MTVRQEAPEPDFGGPVIGDGGPLPGHRAVFADRPLALDGGAVLTPVAAAYQTYGELNAARSNTVLVCHALSGDQFVLRPSPAWPRPGWWETMVGPGRPFDTDRYFVICINVLGGCMGSTGPTSIDPATGRLYGGRFPIVTVADMVRAQARVLDRLGIEQVLCVTGGSMGGMQALQWVADYPERVFAALPIATAAKHSAQNVALHEVGRQAIMGDPAWHGGDYHRHDAVPAAGLSVARMIAHISYLSEPSLERKFARRLQDRDAITWSFDADFQIESYLRYQGSAFVDRFDANSYLYITRAMDYFDLPLARGGDLAAAFRGASTSFFCLSFTGDWLYPTPENVLIAEAAAAAGCPVRFREIESDKGHDAFLLDEPVLFDAVRGFMDEISVARGMPARQPNV